MCWWMRTRAADYTLLLLVIAALTLPNLGASSLWDVDEGVNAEAAREMREAGTWVIPTFNAELRTAKPVFLYWVQHVSYSVLGVSEWSARLPSVLASWLTVLLVYELARRMFGRPTGLLSGLVLASAVEFCTLAHAATPDSTLLLFTVLTYTLFWLGHENGGRAWWVPTAAACGLAALTKGPVGVVLPVLVVFCYFAWNRELARLADRKILWGLLAGLAVAGPWYGMVTAETHGAWAKAFFGSENLNRFLSTMENHSGPPFYHAATLFIFFAPWSVLLGGVLWYAVKWARWPITWCEIVSFIRVLWYAVKCARWPAGQVASPTSPEELNSLRPYRFLVCWFGSYLIFFSIAATKLPNYILPLYPALAILTARFLVRWREDTVSLPRWMMPGAAFGILVVAIVFGGGLMIAGGAISVLPANATIFPGLEKWAILGLVPLFGAGLMFWFLRKNDRPGYVAAMTASSVLLIGLGSAFPVQEMDRYKAPRDLVRESGAGDPTRDLRLGGYDWLQPSVVFYARRKVEKLATPEKAAEFLSLPVPSYLFVPEQTWTKWVADKVAVPNRIAARHFDFYRNCEILVITNQAGKEIVQLVAR